MEWLYSEINSLEYGGRDCISLFILFYLLYLLSGITLAGHEKNWKQANTWSLLATEPSDTWNPDLNTLFLRFSWMSLTCLSEFGLGGVPRIQIGLIKGHEFFEVKSYSLLVTFWDYKGPNSLSVSSAQWSWIRYRGYNLHYNQTT